MNFGLIGKNLTHSYSKFIHENLEIENYQLFSIKQIEEILSMDLDGFNITNPFKSAVIEYLDGYDDLVKTTQSVNTVLKKDNKLLGFNTDYYGFESLIKQNNINLKDKKIIILGNGATSRTVEHYLDKHEAKSIIKLVRTLKSSNEDYLKNQSKYMDTDIIINTTPVGMYPNNDDKLLINFHNFPNCQYAIDLIYNPYRTKFLIDAERFNIKSINGLFMLLMQAKKSQELLNNKTIDQNNVEQLYKKLIKQYVNITFIGLPLSGKSHYGKLLSDDLDKEWIDTDDKIEDYAKIKISQIFKLSGEEKFREIESYVIQSIYNSQGIIISCGGGVILKHKNTDLLKQNGILVYINKSIEVINHDNFTSRPLVDSMDDLIKLKEKRYDTYSSVSDIEFIINEENPFSLERLKESINEYFNY
ncbi:MAG: shikimate dehydrogenase [Tenericutes bacterium]|jgi:shikimate dehydrogenase|nr:shikimate dehydrogenase [Mycoplasmatota bacterium]